MSDDPFEGFDPAALERVRKLDRVSRPRRMADLATEIGRLRAYERRSVAQEKLLDEHSQELMVLEQMDNDARAKIAELSAGLRDGIRVTEGGAVGQHTAYGASTLPGAPTRSITGPFGELRDEARRTIDESFRSRLLPDYAAERAMALVEGGRLRDQGMAARWAVAAGDPHYRTAFAKLLADPTRGHLLWTAEEHASYQVVEEVRTAMSTTAANGGYMIPLTLDPALILQNDGSTNPLRQLARVVQTVSNSWTGVTTAGVTSEWKSENSQVADASPTVGNPVIPTFFGDAFVQYSYEVGMDAVGFLDELGKILVDSADQLNNTAYTTGNGTTAPQGIITGLLGTASEINTTGSEALVAADAYALQNALGPRYQGNASWLANIATINTFAQFETTAGALKFPEIRDNRLLRKPLYELSNMDGSIDATATANNYVMVYGSIRDTFTICDRVGAQLELIPNLMGANARPTGTRGALLWWRTGSKVTGVAASRLLDVPTTT